MNSACKLVGYYRVAAYGLRYDTTSPVTINFWLKYAQIDLVRKMIKLKGLFCGTNMVLQKKKTFGGSTVVLPAIDQCSSTKVDPSLVRSSIDAAWRGANISGLFFFFNGNIIFKPTILGISWV